MLPGGEGSELGVLYREVARAMMVIHRGQGDVSTLVRVAKGAPTRGSIDRRMTFRMMIWLVTYYEFFDKKVLTDCCMHTKNVRHMYKMKVAADHVPMLR